MIYIMIAERSATSFASEVNRCLKDGYKFFGEKTIIQDERNIYYFREMVKE
jgi:hypothetical protein